MTMKEHAAFNAGIEAVRQMAMIAAVTIEARDDALDLRQLAAAAALHGLAEGTKALMLEDTKAEGHCLNVVQNKASPGAVAMQAES